MSRTVLPLLIACSLICAPAMASAADLPAQGLAPVDDLGRVFPDPEILKVAQGWTAGGLILTATGGALMLTGMTLGSAMVRGELKLPENSLGLELADDPQNAPAIDGAIFLGSTMLTGLVLALVGVPMLSSGTYTTKQMLRTIKGAPKVPRTVANERIYWNAWMRQQYGQAFSIAGGAGVAFGILSIVAIAVTLDTEAYRPELWFAVIPGWGLAAGFLPTGLLMIRDGKRIQKQTWDAVDPRRQSMFRPGVPLPLVSSIQAGRERAFVVGWSWSGRF